MAPSGTFERGRSQPRAAAVPGMELLGAGSWMSFASSGQLRHLLLCAVATELQEISSGRVWDAPHSLVCNGNQAWSSHQDLFLKETRTVYFGGV